MSATITDPFRLTAQELQPLLASPAACFPELDAARVNLDALRNAPQTQLVLGETETLMKTIERIPQTSYTLYRCFMRNGDRGGYETPYFDKRTKLAAAALRVFLGQHALKDVVQDYLWNICEESNWVLPAHENRRIDLFSAETGFVLAQALSLLGQMVDAEVRHRVRLEIERRIFEPYLRFHQSLGWYMGLITGTVFATAPWRRHFCYWNRIRGVQHGRWSWRCAAYACIWTPRLSRMALQPRVWLAGTTG